MHILISILYKSHIEILQKSHQTISPLPQPLWPAFFFPPWSPGKWNHRFLQPKKPRLCPCDLRRTAGNHEGTQPVEKTLEKQKTRYVWNVGYPSTLPETNSWTLKMVVSNRNRLFQGSNFRGYVSFREGTMVVFDVHTKFNYVHIYIYLMNI